MSTDKSCQKCDGTGELLATEVDFVMCDRCIGGNDLGTVLVAADAYADSQEEEADQGGWGPSRTEELREDAVSVREAVKRLEERRT